MEGIIQGKSKMSDKKEQQNYDFASRSKMWREKQKMLLGTKAFNAKESIRKQDER